MTEKIEKNRKKLLRAAESFSAGEITSHRLQIRALKFAESLGYIKCKINMGEAKNIIRGLMSANPKEYTFYYQDLERWALFLHTGIIKKRFLKLAFQQLIASGEIEDCGSFDNGITLYRRVVKA